MDITKKVDDKYLQYTETINNECSLVNYHVLKFVSNDLKNNMLLQNINEKIDYVMNLDELPLTLLYMHMSSEVYNFLKGENLPKYAKGTLPSGLDDSNEFVYNQDIHYSNMDKYSPYNNITKLYVDDRHPILNIGGTHIAIAFKLTIFLDLFITLLRKHIVSKVFEFIYKKYSILKDDLFLSEVTDSIYIYYKSSKHKILIFKCKIGKYIPHITIIKHLLSYTEQELSNMDKYLHKIPSNTYIDINNGYFTFE